MKRLCKNSIVVVTVAYTFSNATAASVGWTRNVRHAAVGQAQRGTGSCRSPSTTESVGFYLEDYLSAARHPRRPLLALRGGYNSGESGGDGGGVGGGSGGERNVAAGADGETVGENGGADGSTGIDEDLYSRQLYVMGKSAMAKMGKADVLISGLRSESQEIGDKRYIYLQQQQCRIGLCCVILYSCMIDLRIQTIRRILQIHYCRSSRINSSGSAS